jgi:PAS domain S-box-containing protein
VATAVNQAELVITSGPDNGRRYRLETGETLVGRAEPCQVILRSSGVSRQHARIVCQPNGYFIEDLQSLNGTYLNGERLRTAQPLSDEDCLQIHDTLLTFRQPPAGQSDDLTPAVSLRRRKNKSTGGTSVVASLDVRMGSQSRVEVNPEIKLRAILEIIRSAGAAGDIDQALTDVLEHVFQIFPQTDHGFVLLYEPELDRLLPRAIKHGGVGVSGATMGPLNDRAARQALAKGHAILSADNFGDEDGKMGETIFDIPLRAVMCAPLIAPASPDLGVLQLMTEDPQRQFSQPDLDVLASIGLLVGQLVEYARRYERKGAEGALRRSESRFRALVEKSWDSIAILDPLGKIVYATPGMAEQLGYAASEAAGSCAFTRLHPEDSTVVGELFGQLLAEPGGNRSAEFRVQHADGSWRWLEATGTNLLHDPDVLGIVCNYRDVTGRKQTEERRGQLLEDERQARAEAERLGRMKDEFLATLSHELRTPLNAIVGWADLLQMGKLAEPEVAQGIETIRRNARMQTQIIEDLLDMSRIVSGRIRLEVRPIDVGRLVAAALETVRPSAQAKDIRLAIDCDDCPPVNGDASRLQQVLWNLLVNAIKFTPPQGTVRVSVCRRNDEVECRVADSGEGIEPDFLPHVFERFRQADSSPTRRHGGLGLGLAIVNQLVQAHGGSVDAESPGRGQGSTFIVRLPVAAAPATVFESAPAATAPPDALVSSSLQDLDVLVVDDERDSRDLAARVLTAAGARVRSAASALEALAMFEQSPPDILLADIAMPEVDGYELLRRVRSLPPQRGGAVPAVAVTAFAHAEGRRRSSEAGFQFHLAKPLDRAELLTVVASLVTANPRA